MEEIFKSIKGYPNYQVSNFGRVKSLKFGKERILKVVNNQGYLYVILCKNGKVKNFHVHKLVAICFLNHTPNGMEEIVDHINNDKLNNHVSNLQLTTNRHNTSKDRKGGSSKFVGVSWSKHAKKWKANIYINGKIVFLGYFKCELAASKAYQNKLKETKQK